MAHRIGERAGRGTLTLRLVLDTNVWLDLLVFRDPAVAPLLDALEHGDVAALVEPRMRDELHRVLAYPVLARAAPARAAAAAAAMDRLATAVATPGPMPQAPRCRDPDDQMYVDLAIATCAHALLSRDDALLRLAPRLRRIGIEVRTPAAWCAAQAGQISKR